MSDSGWLHSTEGDLDPDLTEEVGHSGWEPKQRRWLPVLLRVVMALLLVAIVGGMVLSAMRVS